MDETQSLMSRLLAHRYLPRTDTQVRRLLTDDNLYRAFAERTAACGLELAEHPYAEHVCLRIRRDTEQAVFGQGDAWLSTNVGLTRDHIALLVVLWALLILPKRQRQVERQTETTELLQGQMFNETKPIPKAADLSINVAEATIFADFGDRLGGKTRITFGLGMLARLRFIERRSGLIYEGPLLDLAIDYEKVAPRILDGALADVFQRRKTSAAGTPSDESV